MYKAFYATLAGIEKRVRFIISVILLSSLVLISTFFYFDASWIFIPVFIIASYICTYFSLLEGIEKLEWVSLFLMPVLVTVSFYLFYFLFPVRWLTRIPFIIFYAVSIYAMFLVSNIFNVGVEKSLQLYRAAFSVNYFYQTLIVFLFANLIYSLKINVVFSSLLLLILGVIIAIHLLWSIKLELYLERSVLLFGALIGFVLWQVALIVSFVPLQTTVFALLISALFYSIGGLTYLYLDQRLFKETIREYIFVLIFVILIIMLTISW
ncbi:MAG: hypothetical protein WC489_03685 [Patescibacteria group bacterium]